MKDLKIFTNNVEESAVSIIDNISESIYFDNKKIRIMPDVHAGKDIVIGFTCPIGDYLNPNHIGVDIGCGIETVFFDKSLSTEDYKIFEKRVKESIPMGFNLNPKQEFDLKDFCKFIRKEISKAMQSSKSMIYDIQFSSEKDIAAWCKSVHIDSNVFYKSIGTLGGGNHFIELDSNDEFGLVGLTVHTGSRNLGVKVCGKWVKKTVDGYLSGDDLKGYLTDMVICQGYAKYNRKIIIDKICKIYKKLCKGNPIDHVCSIHNYLDFDDMIIRKGAIRSYINERLVIPFNMRDGIAICAGKSNDDWNCSAPHGSGRALSRRQARENLSMTEFTETMNDIYTTSVCENTLDESPMAYKNTEEIIELIKPTCEVKFLMKPLINIKDTSSTQ